MHATCNRNRNRNRKKAPAPAPASATCNVQRATGFTDLFYISVAVAFAAPSHQSTYPRLQGILSATANAVAVGSHCMKNGKGHHKIMECGESPETLEYACRLLLLLLQLRRDSAQSGPIFPRFRQRCTFDTLVTPAPYFVSEAFLHVPSHLLCAYRRGPLLMRSGRQQQRRAMHSALPRRPERISP